MQEELMQQYKEVFLKKTNFRLQLISPVLMTDILVRTHRFYI